MSFTPRFLLGALDLTEWPFMVEFDPDMGDPENAAEIVGSLLADGEIVSSTRTSNRVLTLAVLIEESDLAALAAAEAALIAECDKPRNALTVVPGDGFAASTVFDTFRAQASFRRNDAEEMNGVRRWVLTIPALPFGHAVAPVTVTSTAALSPTRTVVKDGSTTTGWTPLNATVATATVGSRACIQVTSAGASWDGYNYTTINTVDVAIPTSSTYLSVDVSLVGPGAPQGFVMFVSGVQYPPALTETQADGFVRYFYNTASLGAFTATFRTEWKSGTPFTPVHYLDDVATQSALPSAAGGKQSIRAIPVLGSVRAPGSIHVSHASTALAQTIVFTSPDLTTGYTPELRRWRTAGAAETTDAAMISGKREVLAQSSTGAFTATVPNRMYPPGSYMVVARVSTATIKTVTVLVGSGATTYQTASTVLAVTSGYAIVGLGLVRLPAVLAAPEAAGSFTITIHADSGSTVDFDEAWVFPVENSALTISNNAGQHLWLESPSLTQPRGAAWTGALADKSDALSAYSTLLSNQRHLLTPAQMLVFVAASGPTTPVTVEATYFPHCFANSEH